MIIYGIKNCDKIRAAMKWAKAEGIKYQLHDYRVDGIDQTLVKHMLADISEDKLLNKRSTTWKGLTEVEKELDAKDLLLTYPTLIKRPVVNINDTFLLGYEPEIWKQKL